MGLIQQLHYEVKEANAVQRVTQRIAASRPGAWLFQHLYLVDRGLFRLTDGRVTVPGLLAGLPVIMLTTIGAKSGNERTCRCWVFRWMTTSRSSDRTTARSTRPDGFHNLRAHPDATVAYRMERVAVTARRATEVETERAFEAGVAIYGGYSKYRRRASQRQIEVFVLQPRRA